MLKNPIPGYWNNKTVVVSGGHGFIGSHFVGSLASAGSSVYCLHRSDIKHVDTSRSNIHHVQIDLLNAEDLMSLCTSISPKIDCFIHTAALDGNTQYKLDYAAEILESNNRLTSNVLNSCRHAGVEDLVIVSSAEVYSKDAPDSISENDDYHKYIGYTENGYVLSKVFSEMLAELYMKQYSMNIYLPRPTNVYGPGDSFEAGVNRVIPSMIHKVESNEDIEIWGNGTQTRSFIFVKDLIQATLQMVEKRSKGPMNIATDKQVSILELAHHISKEFNVTDNIRLDLSKPVGVKNRSLDITKMYNLIDFTPIDIEHGIKETVKWYKEYHTSLSV